MANWVSNCVIISADKATIKEIKEFVKGIDKAGNVIDFDFRKIVPEDPNVMYTDEIDDNIPYVGWYEWRIKFWDTKWNASDVEILNETEEFIEYHFETAWYYPENVFIVLSKLFPDAEITVSVQEETLEFSADMTYKGGKSIDFIDTTEEMRKEYAEED